MDNDFEPEYITIRGKGKILQELKTAAKKQNILVIGMVKSWDNLVKDIPIRLRPDILFVWNEVMKNQAINYQYIPKNKIKIVGIPQFDIYEKVKNTNSMTTKYRLKNTNNRK